MSGVKKLEILQKSLEINLGIAQVEELRFWFQDAWGNNRVFYGCVFKRGIIVVRLKCIICVIAASYTYKADRCHLLLHRLD